MHVTTGMICSVALDVIPFALDIVFLGWVCTGARYKRLPFLQCIVLTHDSLGFI